MQLAVRIFAFDDHQNITNNTMGLDEGFSGAVFVMIKGGVALQNIEIAIGLKGQLNGQTFWSVLEVPDN